MTEEYSLPQIFKAKGKLHISSESQTHVGKESSCDDSEVEVLKTLNKDLCKEMSGLKIENDSLADANKGIKVLQEKVYAINRNTNKKLGRRDNAILEQSNRLDKQKVELDKLHKKVTQMESQLQLVRKDKERLRHKAEYWRTRSHQIRSSSEEQEITEDVRKQQEIETLKQGIQDLEENSTELEDKLCELSVGGQIETFQKGHFTDNVRTCCYELLSLNVGIRNISPVIRTVMKTLAHQSVGRLPSQTALCRMMLEGLSLSEIQLGQKLTEVGQENFTLQTDGTTKYGKHFATFDVATEDCSYTLGVRLVFSGSAQNTLDTLREILDDLDMVHEQLGGTKVSSTILSKLKNTMSDRHSAEKLFNELLSDYRAEILPEVMAGWAEANEAEKVQLTRMNNFFCGLHFMVGLADCADATLKLWEQTHELPRGNKSSGTQQLVRTACKSFHARGSQQAGCSAQFRAYLRSKGIVQMPLAAFRGNRFNILFYDAAGVYFLRTHMIEYLTTSHGSLNLLLQAVSADLQVPQYITGCRALGIIDKLITGPLWRHLQLSTASVLSMSDIYTQMKEKFEEWGEDAQAVLEGGDHLLRQHEKVDEVYKVLFIGTQDDCVVQELLQLLFKSFAATVQRLLLDHLPGGQYNSVTDIALVEETKSVPTTNVSPERDFAILDRLMSEKPNATHIALESLLLYSHNKTSAWLQSQPPNEREKLLKAARSLSQTQRTKFQKRREEVLIKRQDGVRRKEQEYLKKKEKDIKLKESLTKKIQKFGLWTTRAEVKEGLKQLKSAKSKVEALKIQINFRRKVLEQMYEDRNVFFFSHKGKQHSHTQLSINLMKLLPVERQALPADQFRRNPHLLVNKRIDHLFDSDSGLQWYRGTVVGYVQDSKQYRVVYDSEDCEYLFPLLEDLMNGELIVYDQ